MANNFLPIQTQPFTLAGSGAVAGATSVTLSSLYQIDGTTAITMADLGTIAYMTLEPGVGTQEEQISFTGITANGNGTFTLTGVKTVLFSTPYTETSGLAKSHPGGSTAIFSNTAGFYTHFVSKDDEGTINQDLTFAAGATPKITDAPAVPTEAVNKAYADGLTFAGAPDASTTVKGIVQSPSQSQVDSKAAAGSTAALLYVPPDKLRATKYNDYVLDTGTASAFAIAPSPVVTQYVAGLEFVFKAAHTNAATPTLAVNGLAAKAINYGQVAAAIGSIRTHSVVGVVYDGTAFQIKSVSKPMLSQESSEIYATSTTGTTAYAVALSPVLTAYAAGLVVNFKPDTGGGHATLNVNSLGAKNISRYTNGTLGQVLVGDIVANQLVTVVYDGTQFQMQSPRAQKKVSTITTTYDLSTASGTQTLPHGLGRTPTFVRIYATGVMTVGPSGPMVSWGTYNGTTNTNISGNGTNSANSSAYAVYLRPSNSATEASQTGVITVDAVNVNIAWTKLNSPTGTGYLLIECVVEN